MPVNRNTAVKRRRRSTFNGGSFAAGLVLGIVLTLTGALLPTLLDDESAQPGAGGDAPTSKAAAAPKFEFFESLPRTRVEVDTKPYESASPRRPAEPVEYLLQAGSFTDRADAEAMRQSVSALGLPASTVAAQLADGVERHRVIVGPFAAEDAVRRAQSQLRERKIDALLLARKPAAG